MIRHLLALFVGLLLGAVAASALLFYNPLAARNSLSPLSVSDQEIISLGYSAVAEDAIVFTNDGESIVHPYPVKVQQLWEAPIRRTEVLVTVLSDSRNKPAGVGIKFMSDSEQTRIINGEALVDSAWHILLPGRGSMFVAQTENYWNFLRQIVVPAYWSSGDSWKGSWHGNTTVGPGALGTARVSGGFGEYAGLDSEAVEAISARAYSVAAGPVAMEGRLTIEVTGRTESQAADLIAE
jgi:hypothetical protein